MARVEALEMARKVEAWGLTLEDTGMFTDECEGLGPFLSAKWSAE